ncbi:hypothetical protein [Sphingomonas sp. 22176]|uniref:hypothetical protein n=1 Tax=Sphingomonas sp. 22176 TaxID=3453884 RepID=UPI003F82A315
MADEIKPTTTGDIRKLLAHLLAGAVGEDEAHWLKLIGPVTALPIIDAPRSNWQIEPKGKPAEIDARDDLEEAHRVCEPGKYRDILGARLAAL